MSKLNHVQVLLRKDWLILRRNWLYMLMFCLVPIVMMTAFWYLEASLDSQIQEEKSNLGLTKYGKVDFRRSSFMNSGMSNKIRSNMEFKGNVTAMLGCAATRRKDIGLVAPKSLSDNLGPHIIKEFKKGKLNVHIFEDVDTLFEDITSDTSKKYCFAFQLTDVIPKINEVNVTIYFPRDDFSGLINTYTPLYDLTLRNPDWLQYNKTMLIGTPHFMIAITDFLLLMLRGFRAKELELAFIPMKTPAFKQLPPFAAQQLSQTFPFFFMCIFLLPLYYMVTRLSEEKESKAREGMKMMGLTDSTYYVGQFIFNGAIVSWMSFLVVSIMQLDTFEQSNPFLIFLMCILYGAQIFGFSFSIVSLLPSKKASATAASVIHLSTYYFVYTYKGYGTSLLEKALVACFIPNVALGFMLDHLLHVDIIAGTGLTLQTALMPFQSFNFYLGLVCQIFCCIIWALIGIYLDKIMPREFGKAEPWDFIFQKKKKVTEFVNLGKETHDKRLVQQGNFEEDADYLVRGESLKIRNLKKCYSNGTVAVCDESMTMYKGQIFALLGHNGAGKTTTISMLTGLIEPTQGKATVDGIDIFSEMKKLRENLGVCPQHNVLFSDLTVREHLEIFCALKGKKSQYEINRKVDKMISQFELEDVQNQLASTLSGGQKRKLSVGIALIGDAKIVMLDEPTSGMDTTTRRRFWDIIKLYKKDRIIILTTHYMDEADVLGDRICIMAEGKVQCCGTSLFLKKRFGIGYNLKLTKTSSTNSKIIADYIQSKLKEAKHLQEVSSEITWQLPETARSNFKSFFNDLDKDLSRLNLSSYGVSITTLEEVFLKIGHGEDDSKVNTIEQIQQKTADLSKLSPREILLTEYSISQDNHKSFIYEMIILMKRKILLQIRDFRSCFMDILLPCIMIVGGIYISKLQIIPKGHPSRNLSLYDFPQGRPFVHNVENFNQTEEDIEWFFKYAYGADIGPNKLWSKDVPLKLNISEEIEFFDQVSQMDDYLFNTRNESGPYFAEIFVQQADRFERQYSIASFVNTSQPCAAVSAATYMLQGVVRAELDNPNFRLNFFEAQLPFSMEWQLYINTGVSLLSSLGFAIAFMMISDTLIQSLLKERQQAIKHQIMISGGSKIAYWLSHYILDVLTHSIPATLTCLCIKIFEVNAPEVEVIFFWFCLANPIFIYAMHFVFYNDSMASVFIRVFYFAMGGVAPIAMQVLQVINKQTIEVSEYLKQYFIFVPVYNMNYAYISISNRATIELLKKMKKNSLHPLDFECAGEALYMIQYATICLLVLIVVIENNIFTMIFHPLYKPILVYLEMIHGSVQVKKEKKVYDIRVISSMEDMDYEKKVYIKKIEDQDPFVEEQRVKTVTKSAVKVQQLTKQYTPFYKAVDNLSFALDYGECFALLGITGAGKTSTFKCLCQEEIPDLGTLNLAGHDVRSLFGFSSARQMIGYCPQFDAIYELLTVKEHLEFYATIKGVRQDYRDELVIRQIRDLDLLPYKDVPAGKLSGGNKRKLSCAIALIGNPPIILLDEPSTGVDPQAKRFMWTVISNISTLRKQSTVILTTHSMEEAEALCPKMGIMVDGKFLCFGSAQHIKDKYSDGYDIDLKIRDLSNDDLDKYLRKIDLKRDSLVDDKQVIALLKKLDMINVWDKKVTGDNDLSSIFRQESPFSVVEVLKWANTESKGLNLIDRFEQMFGECQLLEHFSNRFLVKVAKNNFSIGYVFGIMEELKTEFQISEYSATQTTLEQIFNLLARQKGISKRHESVDAAYAEEQAKKQKSV